ncbi:MAG: type 1 glutamine amidotransferase [Candidatus Geothermincolia bacterium]
MSRPLTICHLYPELMNIYGDRGNVITLRRRCEWRGMPVEVHEVSLRQRIDPDQYDIFFLGGGQDREQVLVCQDLLEVKGEALRSAAASGACFLTVCGGYQLLGRYFLTYTGETLPGIEIFDAWTEGAQERFIGNMVIEVTGPSGAPLRGVGFENHSGHTYLGETARPLGRVVTGYGNNGVDGMEGCRVGNAIGTYLHGSLLPKNPWLADELLLAALRRHDAGATLAPLDDFMEEHARDAAIARSLGHKGIGRRNR